MLNTWKSISNWWQAIRTVTCITSMILFTDWITVTHSQKWKCNLSLLGNCMAFCRKCLYKSKRGTKVQDRTWIQDGVMWWVQSPTANTCKNLRFHFHVYKLAFGFSPHGKQLRRHNNYLICPRTVHCLFPPTASSTHPVFCGGGISLNCRPWGFNFSHTYNVL